MPPFEIDVDLEDEPAWDGVVAQVRDHGAALLDRGMLLDPPLAGDVVVVFHRPDGEICRGAGRLVQVFPTEVVVEFQDPDSLAGTPWKPSTTEETPLWRRYSTLPKPHRIQLARKGNIDARRAVLRDRDQSIHVHLLANPGLTSAEVASMLRLGATNPTFIAQVVGRSELMADIRVVEALVRNPKTPMRVAVDAVGRLPLDVVARIARQSKLRDPILSAARKRVVQRQSRR